MLKLYSMCEADADSDEGSWQAWWCESQEDAERRYRENYEYPYERDVGDMPVQTCCTDLPDYAPVQPAREGRMDVLRLAGWRSEGEGSCCQCGLYPNDMEEFALCPECDYCPECGHDDDCPNLTSLKQ